MRHVIVGNSIAGMEAALAIRRRDGAASITIVSAESDHPFSRPALMYVFCGQLRGEDSELYDRGLYDRLRFTRVRDRVVGVDVARRALRLERGGELPYDRLLLAVGSKARRLPFTDAASGGAARGAIFADSGPSTADPIRGTTEGAVGADPLHHFVTRDDADRLDATARPGMSAAVVGGGLVGVEVAEILHHRGLQVHWLVREPWTWPVALDRAEAALVEGRARASGVDVRTGWAVSEMRKEDAGVVLTGPNGELAVDLVVAAIGVVPNTRFLVGSGVALAADGGIETRDDLSSTSAPDVYAAGDCANVTWADGSRRPETLWYTARDQGRAAGAAMAGETVRYRRISWTNSAKFFDLEYSTAGFVPLAEVSGRTHPGPGHWQTWSHVTVDGASLRIVLREGRVMGFNALGRRWDTEVWLRWIREGRTVESVVASLQEARFDEEFTPVFAAPATWTIEEGA